MSSSSDEYRKRCLSLFCRYERLSWIPVLLAYLVALGVGGKNLSNPPTEKPTTAASALSFASVLAGFVLTYTSMACDFTTYMDPGVSRSILKHSSQRQENLTDLVVIAGGYLRTHIWGTFCLA